MLAGRKIATTSAAGAGAAMAAAVGFLAAERVLARHVIGTSDDLPPSADGIYGDDELPVQCRCVVLGDSAVVGYGMERADDTPPALVGSGLAHLLDTAVEVRSFAQVGAQTTDLADQITAALQHAPDLAVIVIGANDVTHQVRATTSVRALREAVARLVDAGTDVVVGTCPDLAAVRPIPQPLRTIGGVLSRRLAKLQTIAVVEAGGRSVSLGALLGPVFTADADVMFGADRFHPSAVGYANLVGALLPSAAAAVRARDHDDRVSAVGRQVMPLERAAEEAAATAGIEVTRVGRWAGVLRRRLPHAG